MCHLKLTHAERIVSFTRSPKQVSENKYCGAQGGMVRGRPGDAREALVLFPINRTWWNPIDRFASLSQLRVSGRAGSGVPQPSHGTSVCLICHVPEVRPSERFGSRMWHEKNGISRLYVPNLKPFSSPIEMRQPNPTRFLNGIPLVRGVFSVDFEQAKIGH